MSKEGQKHAMIFWENAYQNLALSLEGRLYTKKAEFTRGVIRAGIYSPDKGILDAYNLTEDRYVKLDITELSCLVPFSREELNDTELRKLQSIEESLDEALEDSR